MSLLNNLTLRWRTGSTRRIVRMMRNVQLLDCTLRDGGQGLEAAFFSGMSEHAFEEKSKKIIIDSLSTSKIEIVELGCIGVHKEDRSRFANYHGVEEVSRYIPKNRNPKQMYTALYIGPDTPESLIPEWYPNCVDSGS